MLNEIRNIKSTRKELREFGLIVGGILVAIACVGLYKGRGWAEAVMGVGVFLIAAGVIVPKLLLPAQKAWMALAVVLGAVMSRVILALLFYLVLTPLGIVARLTGKRFIEKEFKGETGTYWLKRGPEGQSPDDIEKQF